MGYIDFETLYGIEGVGLANIVTNAQDVDTRDIDKQLRTLYHVRRWFAELFQRMENVC